MEAADAKAIIARLERRLEAIEMAFFIAHGTLDRTLCRHVEALAGELAAAIGRKELAHIGADLSLLRDWVLRCSVDGKTPD